MLIDDFISFPFAALFLCFSAASAERAFAICHYLPSAISNAMPPPLFA